MNSLGSKLKDLRTSHNLTMEQLADKLNARYNSKINKGMLSKWENNLGEPSLENMRILANFYKVSLDFLLNIETQNTERMLENRKKELKPSIDDTTIKLDKNSSVNNEVFGQRLKQLLQEKNETTYSIAEVLHLSAATISRYTTGDMTPKITTIERLASYFDINPVWLMGYNVEKYLSEINFKISLQEKEHLQKYRQLDEKGQHTVDTVLGMEYNRCTNDYLKPIAAHNDNINDEELEKINRDIERLRAKAITKRNK